MPMIELSQDEIRAVIVWNAQRMTMESARSCFDAAEKHLARQKELWPHVKPAFVDF